MEKVITKDEIKKGLKKLGLKKGNVVLVHSSLSSLGKVEGGSETVIQALIETVGKKGTVMMPYPLGKATIAKVFSSMPGVYKSIHPIHSVYAMGAKARYLTKDHDKMPTACGKGTPFGKLVDLGGYILLIGVDQDRSTTLHTAEDYADLPYLSEAEFKYIDESGNERTLVLKRFPGPHRNFIEMDRVFREKRIMKIERIGNAMVRFIDAKKMIKVCLEVLKKDPAAFLCKNPNCSDCVMQRGKIKEARLKKEDFILSAAGSEVVQEPEEMLRIIQGQGIKWVELYTMWNKKIVDLESSEIEKLNAILNSNGFRVSGIRSDINRKNISEISTENVMGKFEKCLDIVKKFDAKYIVVSSFYTSDENKTMYREKLIFLFRQMAEIAGKNKITVLVENEPGMFCAKSSECAEIIEAVNSSYFKLAFNPANFAKLGEKPFLGISPHIRRMGFVFYVNDALFSGEPQIPGYGNAEIKELISILRCWCFSGFFCIKPGLGSGKENFNMAANAFWHLLETM